MISPKADVLAKAVGAVETNEAIEAVAFSPIADLVKAVAAVPRKPPANGQPCYTVDDVVAQSNTHRWFTGDIVVIHPKYLESLYRRAEYQLVFVDYGSGLDPEDWMGMVVNGSFLGGEFCGVESTFRRHQFIGVLKED